MELQQRYIVLKEVDVAGLDPKAQAQLRRLEKAVEFQRELRGKGPLESVVVEQDWPEYERTVESILRRAEGLPRRWWLWDVLGMVILLGIIAGLMK